MQWGPWETARREERVLTFGIYDASVGAKERCGEDTSALSLSTVADTLRALLKE